MRLFIAIRPTSEVGLDDVRQRLVVVQPGARMVPKENLHLTMAFLGELAQECIQSLVGALDEALIGAKVFRLKLCGLGAFPSVSNPRVVWCGVEENVSLQTLHQSITAGLESVRVKTDEKAFHPHVTIARLRTGEGTERLRQLLHTDKTTPFEEWRCGGVQLMSSTPMPQGPQYQVLHRFAFKE